MIETVVLNYLLDEGFSAYMERPSKPPEEYVLLEKTGSRRSNLIVTSTFAIQSYAASLADAAKLNEQVKEAMNEADTLTGVSASVCVSDYNYTNTTAKQYRYQAVYEITHKE
jgi:hypothetical protein